MREEMRWLRHENVFSHFSLLAANLINNPVVKVSPKRPVQSSTKHITWTSKISVKSSSILQPVLAK